MVAPSDGNLQTRMVSRPSGDELSGRTCCEKFHGCRVNGDAHLLDFPVLSEEICAFQSLKHTAMISTRDISELHMRRGT